MNIYQEWGFIENPFNSSALQADESGKSLLVGREREAVQILRRLYNPPAAVTIEGLNGVGKTSLVNVSIYETYLKFFEGESKALYIPCHKTFQLTIDKSIDEFVDSVYIEIAQTLIKRSQELKNLGFPIPEGSAAIDKWLNSPHLSTWQGSLGPFGAGKSEETNTSEGFEKSGFKNIISHWIEEIFPHTDSGGIVCIIDNMELLETSEQARRLMEKLRDEVFNIPGIRWVLCGALGIIKSIASTPRLEGYLHQPLEIQSIERKHIKDLFDRRVEYYKTKESKIYLPLTSDQFDFLYEVLNENLRNTIHYTDQYCMYIADNEIIPENSDDKEKYFVAWLQEKANEINDSVNSQLRPRAKQLFEDIIKFGGLFSPSDYDKLGFNSIPALRPHVSDLEKVSLLVSTIDETDNRRKTIQITPKGWLASYAAKIKNQEVK